MAARGIAHDFNNILTALIGYGSLLQMNMNENDRLRVYVNHILASSQKAANLTQGLLAFSRKQPIALRPCKVNTIIANVESLLRRLLTEDIDLRMNLTGKALTVMADATQIEQVLLNLATNARDSMPQGGTLSIETSQTDLDQEFTEINQFGEPGLYSLISVRDTGKGMDEETKERIFEPFFTTKEAGKGTGLGLSIVYGIVKQHNGYITVSSEPGSGTVFSIFLPMAKTPAEPTSRAIADIKGGDETILIAEDNREARHLMREILTKSGYTVIEAVDGEDAIARFTEHKDKISLLMLDVVMPRKNGKEAYETIRELRPGIKTIFTSGYTNDVVLEKGIHDKSVEFISKPVPIEELLSRIRTVLDNELFPVRGGE
jgi:CheY-like chemotaxis protein